MELIKLNPCSLEEAVDSDIRTGFDMFSLKWWTTAIYATDSDPPAEMVIGVSVKDVLVTVTRNRTGVWVERPQWSVMDNKTRMKSPGEFALSTTPFFITVATIGIDQMFKNDPLVHGIMLDSQVVETALITGAVRVRVMENTARPKLKGYGYDAIRLVLSVSPVQAVQRWDTFMAGGPPLSPHWEKSITLRLADKHEVSVPFARLMETSSLARQTFLVHTEFKSKSDMDLSHYSTFACRILEDYLLGTTDSKSKLPDIDASDLADCHYMSEVMGIPQLVFWCQTLICMSLTPLNVDTVLASASRIGEPFARHVAKLALALPSLGTRTGVSPEPGNNSLPLAYDTQNQTMRAFNVLQSDPGVALAYFRAVCPRMRAVREALSGKDDPKKRIEAALDGLTGHNPQILEEKRAFMQTCLEMARDSAERKERSSPKPEDSVHCATSRKRGRDTSMDDMPSESTEETTEDHPGMEPMEDFPDGVQGECEDTSHEEEIPESESVTE